MNSSYAAIEHVLLDLDANSKIKNTESLLHCGWCKGPMDNSLNFKKVAILLQCWIFSILGFSKFILFFGIKEKAHHRSLEKETCCQLSSSQLLAFLFHWKDINVNDCKIVKVMTYKSATASIHT